MRINFNKSFTILGGMAALTHAEEHGIKIATFNIRYAPTIRNAIKSASKVVFSNSNPPWGERPWSDRGPLLADQVLWELPDVIGFQEVLWHQLEDLSHRLSSAYDWVGVGRDDGKQRGEAVPLFWRKDKFELIDHEHFWLSETPSVPGSKSWDMGQTRMVTLARFRLANTRLDLLRHQNTAQPPTKFVDPENFIRTETIDEFWILNTHWDDRGERSRTEAANLILQKVNSIIHSHNQNRPLIVLVGDLNSPDSEDGYRTLTGHRYIPKQEKLTLKKKDIHSDITFFDTRHSLVTGEGQNRLSAPYGLHQTYTGFQSTDEQKIIDFVLVADVSPAGDPVAHVTRYGVSPNYFDSYLISDHRMVSATLSWQ